MRVLKMSILVLFHPIVAFEHIQKTRDDFKWYPVFVLLGIAIVVRIFVLQFTHYPLSSLGRNPNLMLECATLFVPLVSWAVASYLVTTIMDGETMFRESMLACSYALVPYILISIPLTLFSHIIDINMQGFYNALSFIAIAWVVLLIIMSLKVMNHFSGSRTLGVVLISLFMVAVLWVAVALVYTICNQFIDFLQEVFTELRYRF